MTNRNKWKYAGEDNTVIVDPEGFIVADVYDERNINLIRLAPELLEALEERLKHLKKINTYDHDGTKGLADFTAEEDLEDLIKSSKTKPSQEYLLNIINQPKGV